MVSCIRCGFIWDGNAQHICDELPAENLFNALEEDTLPGIVMIIVV